jgi:hypothetical protein
MEKLIATLTELLLLQRSQHAVGLALVEVLNDEESLAEKGFTVVAVQEIVARKDQLIHRFSGAEHKRRALAANLGFLINLDLRQSAPTLTHLVAALKVYSDNVRRVLDAQTLERVQRAIEIYCTETEALIPEFTLIARRIQRNQRIAERLRDSIARTVRYFEQACGAIDTSYDKGGKLRPDKSRASRHGQLAVKA